MEPPLAAVGSATVAVLSQSSDIERPFLPLGGGHVVYNNCALYMLLYKQQCVASTAVVYKRVVNARSVFWEHHLVLIIILTYHSFYSPSVITERNDKLTL